MSLLFLRVFLALCIATCAIAAVIRSGERNLPAKPVLKYATRAGIIKRQSAPRDLRPRASSVPFPKSGGTWVSTGTTPWAVYPNLDLTGPGARYSGGVANRDACHTICEANSDCVADTWREAVQGCYIVPKIDHYQPKSAYDYVTAVRGITCEANAKNIPSNLDASGCYNEYRAM